MDELKQFEYHARKRLEEFQDPKRRPRGNTPIAKPQRGVTVVLAVRRHGEVTNHHFAHRTNSISKLQARLEAERAARQAGWPVIAYVMDYL